MFFCGFSFFFFLLLKPFLENLKSWIACLQYGSTLHIWPVHCSPLISLEDDDAMTKKTDTLFSHILSPMTPLDLFSPHLPGPFPVNAETFSFYFFAASRCHCGAITSVKVLGLVDQQNIPFPNTVSLRNWHHEKMY